MTPIEITRQIARRYFAAREQAIRDALAAAARDGDPATPEDWAKSGRAVLVRRYGQLLVAGETWSITKHDQ